MSRELDRARELIRLRRPKEAAAAATRHLAAEPGSAAGHMLLAAAQMALNDSAAAIESATQAVRLGPDAAHAHYVLALALQTAQPSHAMASLKQALRLDPDKADAHELAARLLLTDGKRQEALAAVERAIALDPEDADHHAVHAHVLRALGRTDAAFASLQNGLRRRPEDPSLQRLHGELLLARGESTSAVDAFLTTLRQRPDDEHARAGLLEAMRARYPGYRWVLMLKEGIQQLVRGRRWSVLFLCYFGCVCLALMIAGPGGLVVFRLALVGLIAVLFVPKEIANVALLAHPVGRHVLVTSEKIVAAAVATLLLGAVVAASIAWLFGSQRWRAAAIGCGTLVFLLSLIHAHSSRFPLTRAAKIRIVIYIAFGIVLASAVVLLR